MHLQWKSCRPSDTSQQVQCSHLTSTASAKTSTVKHVTDKSLLRLKNRFELGILYLGCFFLAGLLVYVERCAASSYELMRYFKFITHNQLAFVLGFSAIVLVFHYQLLINSKTEIKCRLLVGDRLMLIKLRYSIECLAILAACCTLSIALHLLLGFNIANNLHLVSVLAIYILASACIIGVR